MPAVYLLGVEAVKCLHSTGLKPVTALICCQAVPNGTDYQTTSAARYSLSTIRTTASPGCATA